ncbi:MAG: tetratricopeptide repeat protein, partial [Bacilli bacterium]|nr:tetratricopeptide repeat protein [Bacilli bacterium]
YEEVVSLVEDYLSNNPAVISSELAYIYGVSLLHTRNKEMGEYYLTLVLNNNPDPEIAKDIAVHYRKEREYIKAKTILENLAQAGSREFIVYYLLAKTEFYSGNYEPAIRLFNEALKCKCSDRNILNATKYLSKAHKHLRNGTHKIDYEIFKQTNELTSGHIVYLKVKKNANGEFLTSSTDAKYYKRTYLIFDIEDDKVYALALSNKPDSKYVIPASVCSNPTDKYILNKVVSFKIDQVECVAGFVDPSYFNELVYYMYHSYHTEIENAVPDNSNRTFNVSERNVLVAYNAEAKHEEYFYVLACEDNVYKTVKLYVLDGMFFPTEEISFISADTPFYDVIPLTP